MGLLDDYGIDLDPIEAPSYDVPDDIYEFEVSDIYIQEGTKNHPDKSWIIIDFLLGEGGKSKNEWFQLPADASNPTDKELEKLGYYKSRLIDLGVAEDQVNNVGRDELVGIRGTLQVATKNGYQNIKNVKVDTDGENEFAGVETTDEAEEPAKTSVRKAPAAKTAPAARAAAAGVKPNPFAKG